MALLVVPLAPDEVSLLTLAEWDGLVACERVLFERAAHPLSDRLRAAGVAAGPVDTPPRADMDGWALIADPGSTRLLELARAGADVTAGVAAAHDALSAAHAAPGVRRATRALGGAVTVMARLRSDDGCPWDREQTHASLTPNLVEEAYEVIDAIASGRPDDLCEELGDLLLQVLFHARLAEQAGSFDVAAVADAIVAKLVYRHPHVFGDVAVDGAEEVLRNWDELKRREGRASGPFDGIPAGLPALAGAAKVQRRARGLGFETSEHDARREALAALDRSDVGDALFWLVAFARARGVDPEAALRARTAALKAALQAR